MKHIHVTCAIIERDGLVLAAQRSAAMSLPHKWEFPGGKIDQGESAEECLRRELFEEMSVSIFVGKHLPLSTHQYESFSITLYPFVCSIVSGEIVLHEHSAIVWLPPQKLSTLDWAEADLPVIQSYIAGENKVAGKKGGGIARKARMDLEEKTGRSLVTGESFLPSGRKTLKDD